MDILNNIKQLAKHLIPAKIILQYRISKMVGYRIDIKKPRTFNEKIQWLKLNRRSDLYTRCADKVEVRDFIAQKIGDEYLIPIHAVYNSSNDICTEELPHSFALKAAHGSGWNIICHNKNELDLNSFNKKVKKWGKTNYYWIGYEYAYKNIPKRFICEELILDGRGRSPIDYKFFCFNGEPHYIQIDVDRFSNHKRALFNTKWERQDFSLGYPIYNGHLEIPDNLEKMLNICKILSENIEFVRVDLYNVNGKIYFGEMTFYPGEGTERFSDKKWDNRFGDLLKIKSLSM